MTVAPIRHPNEKVVEAWVIDLFRKCGLKVWKTSQPRASMITEGLFDLWVFCPRRQLAFWWDVKTPAAMRRPNHGLSPIQCQFRDYCRACNVLAYVGGIDDARALLAELKITLEPEARALPRRIQLTPRLEVTV